MRQQRDIVVDVLAEVYLMDIRDAIVKHSRDSIGELLAGHKQYSLFK